MLQVDMIARTAIDLTVMEQAAPTWAGDYHVGDAELLIEFGGRACYQSWLNPSERSNQEYIGNIIEHGHFSVLEHATVTFYVQGVSRSLTHELVRHRHFSPSQLSQRFVDETNATYVTPPGLSHLLGYRPDLGEEGVDAPQTVQDLLDEHFQASLTLYQQLANILQNVEGVGRKQAREAARAVLPNMTETKVVITGNHRSWREFVQKRHTMHADAEIRELAHEVLVQLKEMFPAIYQDIELEPTS